MTKVIKFKRLCVDTNVIMGLALLYERGEKEFIDTNLTSGSSLTVLKQYAEDLKNLQKRIDNRQVQVVLTPQVMRELKFREFDVDLKGNPIALKPETILRHKLKDLTLEYLQKMPKIKIAKISPQRKQIFDLFTERLATEYVDTFHIFEKNAMGNLPSDARIMAQVTALGMDFVTRDKHFKAKHYLSDYSKADKIAMTNSNMGGYKTKVIEIKELDSVMTNKSAGPKKYFKENTPIAECTYIPYAEYLQNKPLER